MPDSSPPKSHRAPDETDETEAPTESAVEDFHEEAPRSAKRRWKFERGSKSRWPTFAALGYPVRQPRRLRRQPVGSFATVDSIDGPVFGG